MPTVEVPPTAEIAPQLRLAVGRLARRLRQQASEGLTSSQLSALASIERLGPVRPSDLAEAEGVAPPTLTRLLAPLQEAGLVDRGADPDDRRACRLALSAEGRRTLRTVRRRRDALLADRLAELDDDERAQLAAALPILLRLAERA